MTDLIERLQAATEGSRELDAEIDRLNGHECGYVERFKGYYREAGLNTLSGVPVPHYTTSLDAALTLVPEGWEWCAGFGHPKKGDASVQFAVVGKPFSEGICFDANAATPALALCIAALQARKASA